MRMFDHIQFLEDLVDYCVARDIRFYELNYTEQLAVIRSMLVGISRNLHLKR